MDKRIKVIQSYLTAMEVACDLEEDDNLQHHIRLDTSNLENYIFYYNNGLGRRIEFKMTLDLVSIHSISIPKKELLKDVKEQSVEQIDKFGYFRVASGTINYTGMMIVRSAKDNPLDFSTDYVKAIYSIESSKNYRIYHDTKKRSYQVPEGFKLSDGLYGLPDFYDPPKTFTKGRPST